MIRTLVRRFAPRLVWSHRIRTWRIDTEEPETILLPHLADRRKISIDVGAAQGAYAAHLVPLSRRVVAFEPVPHFAKGLREMFSDTSVVEINQVALSDRSGSLNMRVPKDSFWRATIESNNSLRYSLEIDTIPIEVSTLDAYSFRNVGFVKIDVEGHELAVLNGASETIYRERPNLLIEVEEQHRPGALQDVCGFFQDAGYAGLFLWDGKLKSLAAFDHQLHQDLRNLNERGEKTGRYVNNFVFVPTDHPLLRLTA